MQKPSPSKISVGNSIPSALFISLDRNLLDQKSGDVFDRHLFYSRYFNRLSVVVLNTRSLGKLKPRHQGSLHVYPTNSLSRWLYATDAVKIAVKLHRQNPLDIVSTQDPFITALIGIMLKFKTGIPLNIQIHNDYASGFWIKESLLNRILFIIQKISLNFADSIRVVSKKTKKIAPSRVYSFIAPIGVNLHDFNSQNETKTIDIICVARLVKQKNISLLLQAVKTISKKYHNLKTVISGDGPELENLELKIRLLKLEKNVKLIGNQNRHEIIDLLNKSKVFVLPSNYEGWGMAAVEASACRLPVIMTDTGGAGEIIIPGKSGFVVKVGDEKELIAKIRLLLNNQVLRKEMGNLGRRHVLENFSEDKLYRKWISNLTKTGQIQEKLCFVLPSYEYGTHTHYLYTYKLFCEYAKKLPAALFLERLSKLPKQNDFLSVVMQSGVPKPFNLVQRFFQLLNLRLKGYKKFYIHYSYWSLFILRLIALFLPTEIYYWHAESLSRKDLQAMGSWERWQLITAIKLAPVLVTAGEKLAETYADTFGIPRSKVKVVPNWVEIPLRIPKADNLKKKLAIPADAKVILFVHRLSRRKGAHLLPEIIEKIAARIPNSYFLIVGDGPLKENLAARKYSVKVKFVGDVPQKIIFSYYAAADLFIMPSLREGFPRVILEAMAAGLPIVSTDVGEVRNILPIRQRKYIVPVDDVDNFAKVSAAILTSDKLRNELAKANLAKVKEFNLISSVSKLLDILQ